MITRARIALAGASGIALLALAACQEEERQEAQVFETEAACKDAASMENSWWTEEGCVSAFAQAQDRHLNNAPRYDAIEVCEAEHGEGACQQDVVQASSGGSTFLPLMAGYFMGRSMSGTPSYQTSRPLYGSKSGGYYSADGRTKFSGLTGSQRLSSSSFKPAAQTIGKAPITKSTVSSRGGFGRASTGSIRSSGGGFSAGG